MNKLYYKKEKRRDNKKTVRILSFIVLLTGVILSSYIFFPLISWQIYFAKNLASNDIETPIPKTTVLTPNIVKSLINQASNTLSGVDYTKAQNWFPNLTVHAKGGTPKITSYLLSIPKLRIKNALVSTVDTDLSKYLINYPGTSVAPEKGNAVIFGHSTLPQLYKESDYKTIFANLHTLKVGDEVITHVDEISYSYKIYNIIVIDPKDTSVFAQNYDDSYLTLITCTPPGTVWKRLVIQAKLSRI